MPIYPMACMRDRTEPLDEPERTDTDWMDECKHCAACARVWNLYHYGSRGMAEELNCAECEEWED